MNLGTSLNNWLNIRFLSGNNWKGQIGQQEGFCHFDTVGHGLRAGRIILEHYFREGIDTIEQVISKYAPSTENDTEGYIKNVCDWANMPRDFCLAVTDIPHLIVAMCRKETGNVPDDEQLKEMWEV